MQSAQRVDLQPDAGCHVTCYCYHVAVSSVRGVRVVLGVHPCKGFSVRGCSCIVQEEVRLKGKTWHSCKAFLCLRLVELMVSG